MQGTDASNNLINKYQAAPAEEPPSGMFQSDPNIYNIYKHNQAAQIFSFILVSPQGHHLSLLLSVILSSNNS